MTTGPSDQELAKQYWKKQALTLRHQLEENNPQMVKSSSGTAAFRPIQDAAIQGASTKAFLDAFNGSGNTTSIAPKAIPAEVATAKGRIIEAMVQAGKSTAEIEDAMARISPHLDIFALSADPAVQSILLQRLMNQGSGQGFGMKDFVEALRLVQDVRGGLQTQTDPASIMNAAGNIFRAGAETAKSNNNGIDLTRLYEQMSQQQQTSFDRHLSLLQQQMEQSPSFGDQLQQIVTLQNTLSKIGKEPPEVAMKRLELEGAREERQHIASIEAGKDARQAKMWNGIVGTVTKALESPVLREAGKKLAENLPQVGMVAGGLSAVQSAAARSTLDQPLDQQFNFTCAHCNNSTLFTRKQLSLIEASPNRMWSCPHCGEGYRLGADTGGGAGPGPTPPDDTSPGI